MPTQLSDPDRFARLLHARHPAILIQTDEEQHACKVVREAAHRLNRRLMQWSAVKGAYEGFAVASAKKDSENAAAALYHFTQEARDNTLVVLYDIISHLDDPRTLRAFRELAHRMKEEGGSVVLIDHDNDPPNVVLDESTPFELGLPSQAEIEAILKKTLRQANRESELDVEITRSQLAMIVKNLSGLNRRHCEQLVIDAIAIDRRFDAEDLNHILAQKRQLLHQDGVLEYVESPVSLDEIGGLVHLKLWLAHRKDSFSEEAREFGLSSPRGVLMLGVQGAGKSLCAKAIATAWQRPLLRLDPGTLYDRYVGESEKRLRQALHQAGLMAPLVLWIDEIEKGFASAASRSNDGGLSQRMFGTLLTWMQEHDSPVFLVATANDIEALPPELLRKGRFDEIFFVDLPSEDVRKMIFRIHLEKRDRDAANFDLEALANAAEGFSGAEIEQAVVAGLHHAFADRSELSTQMLLKTIEQSPPLSVTMSEKIANLRAWAEGRCVPAG